jgi:hypothetical protein
LRTGLAAAVGPESAGLVSMFLTRYVALRDGTDLEAEHEHVGLGARRGPQAEGPRLVVLEGHLERSVRRAQRVAPDRAADVWLHDGKARQ